MSGPLATPSPWSGSSLRRGVLLALAGLWLLAGCDPNARRQMSVQPQQQVTSAPSATVPMEVLAGWLGMRIACGGQYATALVNDYNSLTVAGPPQPQAHLNGQRLDRPGEIGNNAGRLMVSESLAARLRQYLRFPTPQPPFQPAQPVQVRPSAPPAPAAAPVPPAPEPLMARGPVKGTVVIDAGHGGDDPGTRARGGNLREKDLVLDVAQRVRASLITRGVRVIMTRDRDRFIELEDRAERANGARADLFISIHADYAPRNLQATGPTVYVARGAASPAVSLGRRLEGALRSVATTRGVHRADFKVLVLTRMPAALVELGFLSNRAEAARLGQSAYRQRLAEAIASGIAAALPARR